MPLRFEDDSVHFDGHCVVDEALPLLEFLKEAQSPEIELASCDSMHTSLFLVLFALRPKILSLPSETQLGHLVRGLARGPK
jgi:hypothetical protein